jgi:uncharacterized protein (TIGR02099 family)
VNLQQARNRRLENPFFNRLGSILWVGLVVLIVALATYVSVGRLLTANLSSFRPQILQALNARLPFAVAAEQVSGEWQSFTPDIVLTGLRIRIPGGASSPLELSRGRFGVDVLNSLRTGTLQLTHLVLDGLNLRGELSSEGVFQLSVLGGEAGQTAEPLRDFLLNIEQITLRDNRLLLTLPNGEVRDLALDLALSRDGSERHVQAVLASSAGARITILAQGLGDPFSPDVFSGQVYLAMQSTDFGAIKDLFVDQALPVWADGVVDMELWFNWDRGKPSLDARLESSDLLIASQDAGWQMPLQRVALEARLLEHGDRWTLFVSNLEVANGGEAWRVPSLQLDSWGNALRMRTAEISLAPINAIVTHQDAVPETLREVFTALHPRGHLSALQVSIDDVYQAAQNWQVTTNFQDVAVDSVVGAPGVIAATGYTQMGPEGGFVILDSRAISLDFPAIYHEPLHFEELYGTLHLQWDAEAVTLASDLLTTQGEEGMAKVLFGLNIPLHADDIGIEMDLLVGLQDTLAVHRVKYVPYILDPGLLNWLADSIGDGRIEQGAFLWRGSLRPGASGLRTVQLAFNVADTQLRYHSQWPPVLVEKGVVLIDDSNVSVWADQASLFESSVDQLSVETRLNSAGHITLDLRGSLEGPVADGFRVLNESPLAGIVGSTFAAWTAAGELETDLRLHMDLSDKSVAPRVDVVTHWADVDLQVMPGNLGLQSVNGEFVYSTETGFSSSGLAGTLWGNAVSAKLVQHHDEEIAKYGAATTVVDILLAAELDMARVREWLRLDALELAGGVAETDLIIRLAPGESPLLTVSSDLLGVSLDFPQPWQKSADEAQQLILEMPLSQGLMPLSLQLGEQLDLRLNVDAGAVNGGALGINEAAPPVQEGVFRVVGQAPLIQTDEWLGLVTHYSPVSRADRTVTPVDTERDSAVLKSPTALGAAGIASLADRPAPLRIAVDELRADSVVVFGQELRDVVFSLALDRTQWDLSLTTDWLRGEVSRAGEHESVRLAIEYLDLDRLPDIKPSPEYDEDNGNVSSGDIPPLNVNLSNLYQSEQRLGELHFVVHSQGSVVTVDNITGDLAKLRVRTEQPAQMVWHRGPEAFTEAQVNFDFGDLGHTLEYFGYQRILESVDGGFELELRWPDAPQDFSLLDAQGSMQVAIGQGSFLEAPGGATGALRVVSILNLADIVQRLSLSNMFESGIPFDSVQGEIHVGDGMLNVPHMDVQGGSRFQFSGLADLQTKSLDGELVATLPVVNNLPWIAALAASLPVAAGVYVVSQVFNKQMNRLSSAVYTISGYWNDPEINFDRIFDNTPRVPIEPTPENILEKGGAAVESAIEMEASQSTADPVQMDQSASP